MTRHIADFICICNITVIMFLNDKAYKKIGNGFSSIWYIMLMIVLVSYAKLGRAASVTLVTYVT
jgi:hypothetical protein